MQYNINNAIWYNTNNTHNNNTYNIIRSVLLLSMQHNNNNTNTNNNDIFKVTPVIARCALFDEAYVVYIHLYVYYI